MSKVFGPRTGKQILLVEDDESVRTLMHHVLTTAGYDVDSVASVAEAEEQLAARAYHLVLTDDRLPDGRGIDLADRAATKGIDAVVVTGYGLQMAKDEVARHDYLLKPVKPLELVDAVERHVGAGPSRAHRSDNAPDWALTPRPRGSKPS